MIKWSFSVSTFDPLIVHKDNLTLALVYECVWEWGVELEIKMQEEYWRLKNEDVKNPPQYKQNEKKRVKKYMIIVHKIMTHHWCVSVKMY